MSCDVDISIIGAGVIGLAIACEISQEKRSVIILEKNEAFGRETSSRNSGVIHSSILNPSGSWNAELCYEGNSLLYEFAQRYNISHRKTGKLLVAVESEETSALEALYERRSEGLKMQLLTRKEMNILEPDVNGKIGIVIPSAGVIDAYQLMQVYLGIARTKGAQIVLKSAVTGLEKLQEGYSLRIQENDCLTELKSRIVINSAGLLSDKIASLAGIDIIKEGYALSYFKGEYYNINPNKTQHLRNRLVYPVNSSDGLVRIHTVLGLDDRVRLGPNFYPCDKLDYSIDDSRKQLFYRGTTRLLPHIDYEDIEPESTGIMPRTYTIDQPFENFIIKHESERGLSGLINLVGIESPGLTASIAIAKYIKRLVADIIGN